jgi:hypothetical protein
MTHQITNFMQLHQVTFRRCDARQCCVLVFAFLFELVVSTSAWALQYDKSHPIYDETAKAYAINELQALLKQANNTSNLPVIFYLHGRGDEPDKSFNPSKIGGGAVPRLFSEYGVKVILISWNSRAKGKDRSEPLSHVSEGANTFNAVLSRIVEYEKENPSAPRPSLLVHSMGSIVLAETVKRFGWPGEAGKSIFSNILLSEPDADSQGHAEWLSKVTAVERVYVTQNRRDTVLKKSTDSRNPTSNFALGLDPVSPFAEGARYIDLTDALKIKKVLGVKIGAHQVFTKSWMGFNITTCQFITKVLRGESFEPTEIAGISQLSASHFKASSKVDKKDACFAKTVSASDTE